jgi:small subunit ribosomal protein S16
MAVKIRMTRMGRRHRPFYRINAVDSRTPRDGRILEKLGHYDPIGKNPEKQIVLNRERTEYWLSIGAIPSDSVSEILLRLGIKHKYAEQKAVRQAKARAAAKAKGKFFTKAQEIAAKKAAEEKAKAEAQPKPEEKPKAEPPAAQDGLKAQAKPLPEAKPQEPVEQKAEAKAQAEPVAEEKTNQEPQATPPS